MLWLPVAGAVLLVWLILVFLFTPGIDYHRFPSDPATVSRVTFQLLKNYRRDIRDSDEIALEHRRQRPVWEKIVGPFAWILERQ